MPTKAPIVRADKSSVEAFWNEAACGEELLLHGHDSADFAAQAAERYRLEPYIVPFADFDNARGRRVLEIGVGLGADHERFAAAGACLHGIDLTARALVLTRQRLDLRGLRSDLRVGDAEPLPYIDDTFDIVYSWGVIHHSADTPRAAREILRVLKPNGVFRVMIYHNWSLVGAMLWLRYALARAQPMTSLADIYADHLESPGTKAYTRSQAEELFSGAADLRTQVQLTHGDLLESAAGQRHQGVVLTIARILWPRRLLRRCAGRFGLFLLISGRKPAAQTNDV